MKTAHGVPQEYQTAGGSITLAGKLCFCFFQSLNSNPCNPLLKTISWINNKSQYMLPGSLEKRVVSNCVSY